MSAASPTTVALGPGEAEQVAATVATRLPPPLVPLFDPGFTRSHTLFDEYVFRLAVQVVAEAGLVPALRAWCSVDDAVAGAKLDPRVSGVPVAWLLRHLAARGVLEREGDGGLPRFRLAGDLPLPDPAAVLEEQRRHDPACLPSYTLAHTAARDYPAFLRGERAGDDVLLAPARLPLWVGYFSNDNRLYAINNRVGAAALEAWIPPGATVLELGGGLASGALAVLERLAAADRLGDLAAYRFTELVPAFMRRAERYVRDRFPGLAGVSFATLDMNRPFADQGVAPGSATVVYAVNTLHVAHDLDVTLSEVRRALAPGGQLVVSECVRPWPEQTIYPEFVFNLMSTFRSPRLSAAHRPNGGFLTPDQWRAAFEAAGFSDVRVMPDIARVREVFPTFFVAAIGATRPA
jgi:SAM-dependent methyltransferase